MGYLLGIDLGTSLLKTVLVEESGKDLVIYSKSYHFAVPQKGFVEQDPIEWWLACRDAIAKTLPT